MTPAASREWLETFIELYKSEPCLWKTKSTEYYDRSKKNAAYEKLVKKLQEIEPTATRESVIRKINNIRCTYKKEYNKVIASMTQSNDSVYEPRLWYYNLLSFLDNQDSIKISPSDSDNTNESTQQTLYNSLGWVADTEQKVTEVDWNLKYLALHGGRESVDTHFTSDHSLTCSTPKCTPGPSSGPSATPQQFSSVKEERSDVVGKLVALKLKDLSRDQALLAEKIINETLFEAELGRLTTEHWVQARSQTTTYCSLCNSELLDLPVPVLEYSITDFNLDNT
ncbi:uncharacterized protein LOC121739143 [Aricia agestis]|uniref:uncharacterized protein LOC121739143 n=1 Tax=Aricia agestis TaxID=91739 RepID=UPI001C201971|nr:uncharacterized protein LOC121739143 [Aricia agestis]XP_041987417.1 uncharacterized protein LOC121739143 [Aricia agestis]